MLKQLSSFFNIIYHIYNICLQHIFVGLWTFLIIPPIYIYFFISKNIQTSSYPIFYLLYQYLYTLLYIKNYSVVFASPLESVFDKNEINKIIYVYIINTKNRYEYAAALLCIGRPFLLPISYQAHAPFFIHIFFKNVHMLYMNDTKKEQNSQYTYIFNKSDFNNNNDLQALNLDQYSFQKCYVYKIDCTTNKNIISPKKTLLKIVHQN
jgi:hypothetical protein